MFVIVFESYLMVVCFLSWEKNFKIKSIYLQKHNYVASYRFFIRCEFGGQIPNASLRPPPNYKLATGKLPPSRNFSFFGRVRIQSAFKALL
jgi:hypothetical protein